MKNYNVAIIVGSLRKESFNLKLAKAIIKMSAERFKANILQISDLPLYNQDLESPFPSQVLRLKKEISQSDALLFVTPEYNRSIPAPLKNAIDWASRPYGQNSFAGKRAALCGASLGMIGTACAQSSLKPVFSYLEVSLMGQPEVYLHFKEGLIDETGTVYDESFKEFLESFVNRFVEWIN